MHLQYSLLSPFSVKSRLLCNAFGVQPRLTPQDGGLWTAARLQAKMELAARGFGRCLHRSPSPLDELPLVPWLFPEGGGYLCDSTEIGLYLGRTAKVEGRLTPKDPACAFAVRLIEEAVDEVGLYALHHMRWVASGRTTEAMDVLQDEVAGSLGRTAARLFTGRFGPRQVRRLAYLFSVAPETNDFTNMAPAMRPPSRNGFPPTHRLLEEIWEQMVDAVEATLADGRPYLFGDGLTLADAALMGNLGSTLSIDPDAALRLEQRAPLTTKWLRRSLDGPLVLSDEHVLDDAHKPLLTWASEAFLPLMQRNAQAYALCPKEHGGPRNEMAFDRGINLFEGQLLGHPYRTVVKDFQFKVYRELGDMHAGLTDAQQAFVADLSDKIIVMS
jgi:glutathione S-transferase